MYKMSKYIIIYKIKIFSKQKIKWFFLLLDPVTESVANSQEYGGEKGRFMPPRRGPQTYSQAYASTYAPDFARSLSSQL
jgi:hypothetical protein